MSQQLSQLITLVENGPKSVISGEPEPIMHDDKNLLDINVTKENKYVNAVMSRLFTEEEVVNRLIIDDPSKSRSKRVPLDMERINKLKSNYLI